MILPLSAINGAWIAGEQVENGQLFSVANPATEQPIADVTDCSTAEAERAVSAAASAFAGWRLLPNGERQCILESWADLIQGAQQDLAELIALESGKPLGQAEGEVAACIHALRWSAAEASRIHGATHPSHDGKQRNLSIKQPIGVVACITPWNFPAAAVIVKVAAALAAGCTCILKPSEETPLIALALAKLGAQAGLPSGAFSVLPCSNPSSVTDVLMASHQVRMVTFTGSTVVGKQLYQRCADTFKKMTAELGGNAPFIVFDDADLDKAVEGILGARFYNSGQICVGANRIFVHRAVYESVIKKLVEKVSELPIAAGDGLVIGPLINSAAVSRIQSLVDDAKVKGARLRCGGSPCAGAGHFYPPTILVDMSSDCLASSTEVFGPLACLYPFDDGDDIVAMANDTPAGLAGYIYSASMTKLIEVGEALEVGMVGANSTNLFAEDLPFGGIKESGQGREHGLHPLEEFLETKTLCLGLD